MVTSPREDRDVFRLAPSMDEAVLQTVAARLEFRATDPGYVALSQGYFERLPLAPPCRVLALGCGRNGPKPGPIEDPEGLDERREEAGLPPYDRYLRTMARICRQ